MRAGLVPLGLVRDTVSRRCSRSGLALVLSLWRSLLKPRGGFASPLPSCWGPGGNHGRLSEGRRQGDAEFGLPSAGSHTGVGIRIMRVADGNHRHQGLTPRASGSGFGSGWPSARPYPQGMQGAIKRNVGLALTVAAPQGRSLWGLPVSSYPADPPARGFGPFLSRQTMWQGSWNF